MKGMVFEGQCDLTGRPSVSDAVRRICEGILDALDDNPGSAGKDYLTITGERFYFEARFLGEESSGSTAHSRAAKGARGPRRGPAPGRG